MTHTTDKNYKKKHVFEPSGTYSEIGKELCECGLPLDIPTMHYYKMKNMNLRKTMSNTINEILKELDEYNFCCGGDYCDLTHNPSDKKFVTHLLNRIASETAGQILKTYKEATGINEDIFTKYIESEYKIQETEKENEI